MNLFVGNLSPETTEQQLRTAFSEFGSIKTIKIIMDPQTGMPKGFGFVEMEERRDGYEAITHLDMTYLEGTVISVKEAKNSRQQGGGGNRQGGGNRPHQRREGGGGYGGGNRQGGFGEGRQRNYGDRQGGGNYNNDRRGNFNSDRPAYSKRPNYNSDNYNSDNKGNNFNSENFNNNGNNSLDY
ncbi:MAG TPA: RNA-binding protein [Flavipsychrobacter sp.]|nr:RNA-binding protein [Flavipsychrobacter sp.]